MSGVLYLIPNTLGEVDPLCVIPGEYRTILTDIRHFIVEDVRSVRRYLSRWNLPIPIDELNFYLLNEHTRPEEYPALLEPLKNGMDMGVVSEAGVPGVADPGAEVVALAHRLGIRVVPWVGPSSILLSLMGSGLNGQQFAFAGYLPVKPEERAERIRFLEKRSSREHQTQIFIETPYRNLSLFQDILKYCRLETRLCVAADLTLPTEYIVTRPIELWKNQPVPEIHKRPAVFLLLAD